MREQIFRRHVQEVISVVTRYEAYFRSETAPKERGIAAAAAEAAGTG